MKKFSAPIQANHKDLIDKIGFYVAKILNSLQFNNFTDDFRKPRGINYSIYGACIGNKTAMCWNHIG